MNTTVVQLQEARTLIQKGWARGKFAKDAKNKPISFDDPNAAKFCSVGALSRVVGNGIFQSAAIRYLKDAFNANYVSEIYEKQDTFRNKREVIRRFNKAIDEATRDGL